MNQMQRGEWIALNRLATDKDAPLATRSMAKLVCEMADRICYLENELALRGNIPDEPKEQKFLHFCNRTH